MLDETILAIKFTLLSMYFLPLLGIGIYLLSCYFTNK